MIKYRIKPMAHGWAVQEYAKTGEAFFPPKVIMKWRTIRTWPHHWLATLHLWFLRERARA